MKTAYFKKLFFFIIFISIIPIICIGMFSFYSSSNKLFDKEIASRSMLLHQVKTGVEMRFRLVDGILNQLINTERFKKFLYTSLSAENYLDFADFSTEVRSLMHPGTGVVNTVLINPAKDWVMCESGVIPLDIYQDVDKYARYFSINKSIFYDLDIGYLQGRDESSELQRKPANMINVVKRSIILNNQRDWLMFVQIPLSELQKLFLGIGTEQPKLMILGSNNEIIYNNTGIYPGIGLVSDSFLKGIRENKAENGFLEVSKETHPVGVAFEKSEYNDWIYLSFTSFEDMQKESRNIGFATMFISVLWIAIALIAGYYFTNQLTLPLQRITRHFILKASSDRKSDEMKLIENHIISLSDENAKKEKTIDFQQKELTDYTLKRFYTGEIKQEDVKKVLEQFGLLPQWHWYKALAIHLEVIEQENKSLGETETLKAVKDIVSEIFPKESILSPIIQNGLIVFLAGGNHSSEEIYVRHLQRVALLLKDNVNEVLKLNLIIGVSNVYTDITKAREAVRESLLAIMENLQADSCIIQYNNDEKPVEHNVLKHLRMLKEEVLEALKMGNEEKSIFSFGNFLSEMSKVNRGYEYAIPILYELFLDSVEFYESLNGNIDDISHDISDILKKIQSSKTASEYENWYINNIHIPILKQYKVNYARSSEVIVDLMLKIIHEDYSTDISLNECAQRLNYNPNYIGRVFKQRTGLSFVDYLSRYRTEMAKKYLSDTDMKIGEIAFRVGYANAQNFNRSFMREAGTTPGKYRENHQKQ